MQASLFAAERQVLLDGAYGRIAYFPDCVTPACAQRWFDVLREEIAWTSERRLMYDREVDVPRLVARYGLADPNLPPEVCAAMRAVQQHCAIDFNSVGLNFYRDGRDSVAPHNDKLQDLVDDAPIALLSLGAARIMTIRSKTLPRTRFSIELAPGSLLVMSYLTQLHFDHGIPKTRDLVGPRISLAFRQRRALR